MFLGHTVRDFIYLPEQGRNVMVDVRAVRAALQHVYKSERILTELGVGAGVNVGE